MALGIDDFKKLIVEDYYYVDKTLLIKELIDVGAQATLITRPRRFGKTLNLSMLRYFFEKNNENYQELFKDLHIATKENEKYFKEQGKYPVIHISFKTVKQSTWKESEQSLKELIAIEYERHAYLLDTDILSDSRKQRYKNIMALKGDINDYTNVLIDLSIYLENYHKEKVIILIDEYDTPMQSGYLNGYFDEILNFMKSLLVKGFKDNLSLERGVLTGIMKIAKESIFSDFNNPLVVTMLSYGFQDKFGFTEKEVAELLDYYDLDHKKALVKEWYNGYVFGQKEVIYNPWSILNYCLYPKQGFKPYWMNTGSLELIKRALKLDESSNKKIIEDLIEKREVIQSLEENIVYQMIDQPSNAPWSFLFHAGYLKVVKRMQVGKHIKYALEIPNLEVELIFEKIIKSYFKEDLNQENTIQTLISSLLKGNSEKFSIILKDLYFEYVSFYDVAKRISYTDEEKTQESFHHGFILGLLMYGADDYIIKSNREYGLGRPDVVLIPKDKEKSSYIFEFKWASMKEKISLEGLLEKGTLQIQEKKYAEGVQKTHKLKTVKSIAIAFKGKEIAMKEIN